MDETTTVESAQGETSVQHTDSKVVMDVRNITKSLPLGREKIDILNGISFQILSGEFVSIVGPSGSGKSTLLGIIAGLDNPSTGQVLIDGVDITRMGEGKLASVRNNKIGMVFQAFNLLPRMTLEENVELPLRLAEVDRAERPARVREAVERVKLSARLTHRPTELSGGEQQRASLARALVNRPTILLADEPTGNLDSATGDSIMRLLQEINQSLQMTIVMVTHDRPRAEKFAQRIIMMGDGKLISDGVSS